MRPTVVVIDTTEIKEALRLDRAGWPQLLAWVRAGIVGGAVPEVVLREANRNFARKRQTDLQGLTKAVRQLAAFEVVAHIDLAAVAAAVLVETTSYLDWLRGELVAHGFEIWSVPAVSHDQLLARDLGERKPFSRTGKGYRDALIWESVLEHLPLLSPDAALFLVTRNSTDFAARDGSLDEGLLAEARGMGGDATLVGSLKAAVELLREEAEEELESLFADAQSGLDEYELAAAVADAVVAAAEKLAGTTIAIEDRATPSTGLELSIPDDIDVPEVTEVAVEPESLVLEIYDRYEGDTLALAASVDATLTIEGYVDKADYDDGHAGDVEVIDEDWNEHSMLVQLDRRFQLHFNVLTVANEVENVVFDSAEPI